jgi:hypothetical protein
MTVAFRSGIKGKPSRSVAIAKSRPLSSSTVPPLLFFSLRLVFGQPTTSHLFRCSAHSPSKLFRRFRWQPSEEARKKTERRIPACISKHGSVLGDDRVTPLDACGDVSLHRQRNMPSFSFLCTHSSLASSRTALRQWGEHHVSFVPFEFSMSRSVWGYVLLPL